MEVAEALKHKRRVIMVVRAVSAASALLFPVSCLAFLDPPEPRTPLFGPTGTKVLYTLFAAGCIGWTLKRGIPSLKQAESVLQMFMRGLICVQGTFLCALFGLLAFIVDGPKLGSPLNVLPFVAAAVWVDWRYILPQMAAYQPSERDLSGDVGRRR